MAHWLRFERNGIIGFGTVTDGAISVYEGDMFNVPSPTDQQIAYDDVRILTPCDPSKMICIWNNFHALAAKLETPEPAEPLYLLKAPNSFIAHGQEIKRPASYDGPVVYEGEIGVVIGQRCSQVGEAKIADHIFGYTCINDVTAAKIIQKDPTFPQWTRAKSYDTFGVFGPMIATEVDTAGLRIQTVLNGEERQNYPVADMIFSPQKLASLLSYDMTLMPGDIIACGTSVGVGSMKEPTNDIQITIEGIGTLKNTFVQ